MTNGEIVIRPTALSDNRFVEDGSLILKGYTLLLLYRNLEIHSASMIKPTDIL